MGKDGAACFQKKVRALREHGHEGAWYGQQEHKAATYEVRAAAVWNRGHVVQWRYSRIVQSKTAYYTFYLPVACAVLMQGKSLEDLKSIKDIIVLMGIYFQVQDDYLDCYGNPAVIGKIGTDIEDGKCSWLILEALKRVNEDQKKCLLDNYGKSDPTCVANVKMIYNEVALKSMFKKYKEKTFETLVAEIGSIEDQALQVMLRASLERYTASFERYLSKTKDGMGHNVDVPIRQLV